MYRDLEAFSGDLRTFRPPAVTVTVTVRLGHPSHGMIIQVSHGMLMEVCIWNPTTLDRIWQNGIYVSEHCTDMYIHVHESMYTYVHVCTCT
jgi:hypothetical protein